MLLKFTQQGEVPAADRRARQEQGQRRHARACNKPADVFVYAEDQRAVRRRRLRQPPRDRVRRRHRRVQAQWGAFGNAPIDAPQPAQAAGAAAARRRAALDTEGPGPQQFGGPVHAVKVSNDGLVYVADRPNRRVQVFTPDGKYVTQMFINRAGPANGSAAGHRVLARRAAAVPLRRRLRQLAHRSCSIARACRSSISSGTRSAKPGDFQGAHHLAVELEGRISTWSKSRRATASQRFRFKGLSNTLPSNALTRAQLAATPVAPNQAAPASATPASSRRLRARRRGAGSAAPRTFPAPGQARAAAIRRGPARWPIRIA